MYIFSPVDKNGEQLEMVKVSYFYITEISFSVEMGNRPFA